MRLDNYLTLRYDYRAEKFFKTLLLASWLQLSVHLFIGGSKAVTKSGRKGRPPNASRENRLGKGAARWLRQPARRRGSWTSSPPLWSSSGTASGTLGSSRMCFRS